jgi:glycosyltransferase involved in cell wall biosynthesis
LVPENNIDLIVKAFKESKSKKTLLVAGAANYSNSWTKELLSIQDERIKFIGHVADSNEVRELHCNCYAYFHGHSMGGTNPSLIKALGCGNCIIAFDTPFNSEVLIADDGQRFGILFNKEKNNLRGIIDDIDADPDRASDLRKRSRNRIKDGYTCDQIVHGYEQAFRDAMTK